jgi:hypothetical protein
MPVFDKPCCHGPVCGYKVCLFLANIIAIMVCGYKVYLFLASLIAMVCGYKVCLFLAN